MKKFLLMLALILPSLGWAQSVSFYTDRAVGQAPLLEHITGLIPIQNGQVRVCTFSPTPPIPCTAADGAVFDLNGNPLTVPSGQFGQIGTDVVGRFSFGCVAGQSYTIQVEAQSSNTPTLNYPITCPASTSLTTILGSNNSFTSTNLFNILNAGVLNGTCNVGESVGGTIKYPTIASAVADSACVTIEVPALPSCYSETLSANVTLHGTLNIHFKGCAVINTGGNHSFNHTAGGSAADNLSIWSDFPTSAHANGTNAGVTFTGYTGSTCILCVGNGTNASTSTLNLFVRGINFDYTAASGGAAIVLTNTQQFTLADIWCSLTTASTGCVLLDGTGAFTGVGTISNLNVTGNTGGNQFALRGQNTVTAVRVAGGNINMNGANGICWDAETSSEFFFDGPDCNAAAQAFKEVGALSRISGWFRVDSGVVALGTVSSGTFQAFCTVCSITSPVFTDSTGLASLYTPDGLGLNSQKWRITGTSTSFNIKDVIGNSAPISINSGGNMFLGTVTPIIIDNNGGLHLPGATSGNLNVVAPSVASGTASLQAGTETITVASGTAAMTTAAIGSGACGTTVSMSAPNVLTTDRITVSFNAAPATTNGLLVLSSWPTAGNVNFVYCNNGAGSITPAAATINWGVTR